MANENVIQDPVKQGTPTPAAQDYTPDAFTVSKELYQKNKDTFFADERLYRLDNNGQRDALGKFYDEISVPYYKNAGLSDENSLKELRDKFITDNLGKLDLAKKKEEEATAPKDFPEFLDKSKIYGQFYSKQDAIKPIMGDVDLNKATQGFEATRKMQDQLIAEGKTADTIIPKMLANPDFGYIKSRPEVFMELEETEQKRINKFLKDQGISREEREKTFGMLKYTAEREFIDREKKKYKPNQLSLESLKAAEPFLKDAVPGTFIDPTTGMRKNKPDTEADADQLALIKKYQKEIVNGILASSASSPLSSKKTVLDDKLTKQAEQYQLVEEKRLEAQQALQERSEDWMDKSEEWKMAQFEFIKNQKDLEQEIKDFNDKIDQDPGTAGAISRDPSDKERLQQIVNDSFILKNYWDKRHASFRDNWDAYNRGDGSYTGASAPKRETLFNLENKKAEATAYFEAASRMAYNNEGPEDIKKDGKYMSQIFGDAFLKSFLGEKLTLEDPQTEQEILRKMGDIGMREGISWTNDEMVHMQSKFAEHAMSLAGSLAPDLPMLMMVGGITSSFKGSSPAIKALTKGYKVIRNPVLEKEGATIAKEAMTEAGQKGFGFYKGANKSAKRLIAYDEAVPTGWEVLKEVKPTAIGKLKGLLIGSALDEAAFVGLMGMGPGMMTGMNASHLFLPNVKLKGKVGNLLQPFLDVAYKSGLGATVGMEAGAVSSGMVNAMFTDATVKEEMNKLYPNLDETTKRILAEVAVNAIFFGAVGAVTTGAQKSINAPLGAKYGKYGGNNWTAYFNPVFRGKVFEAAKSADSKGYTDTAKELYGWLDMTKEPITGTELKEQRMAETEAFAQAVPIGMVRTAIEANRQAIRKLEELNNDPKFDGYVTLQTKSVKDVKPMDVVEMEGRYYEVREIAQDGKGKPVEFSMVDVETGEMTKALPEDVKADLHYKVGSRLELAVRLENHYEKLQTLNEVVADRGEYGKDFQKLPAGPPPAKGLGKGTGAFYVKPPEPSKIEKKLKDIESRETEMGDRGKAPIELPETLRKITPFGEPDKFAEMPADTFSSNLSTRQKDIDTKIAGYDTQIADLEAKLNDPKFQKRMDLETKREKTAITDDIARLDHAKNKAILSHSKELSDFFTDAKPELANLIRSKGTFEDEEIDDIIDKAWGQMTNPSKENKGKTIGQIIEDTVAEYTGEKDEVFKLQGKTFKTKDELFAWMDEHAVLPDGKRNNDWFSPDVLPESNVINAIKEWEFRFNTRDKIKRGLEDLNKKEIQRAPGVDPRLEVGEDGKPNLHADNFKILTQETGLKTFVNNMSKVQLEQWLITADKLGMGEAARAYAKSHESNVPKKNQDFYNKLINTKPNPAIPEGLTEDQSDYVDRMINKLFGFGELLSYEKRGENLVVNYKLPSGSENVMTVFPDGSQKEGAIGPVETAKIGMDRMREIEDIAKADGYTFEVNPDNDHNITSLDIYDSSKNSVAYEELPQGIKDLADEFSTLMHDEEITNYVPEEEPDWNFRPKDAWQSNLFKAREYAGALKIDFKGMELEEIVAAINNRMNAYAKRSEAAGLSEQVLPEDRTGIYVNADWLAKFVGQFGNLTNTIPTIALNELKDRNNSFLKTIEGETKDGEKYIHTQLTRDQVNHSLKTIVKDILDSYKDITKGKYMNPGIRVGSHLDTYRIWLQKIKTPLSEQILSELALIYEEYDKITEKWDKATPKDKQYNREYEGPRDEELVKLFEKLDFSKLRTVKDIYKIDKALEKPQLSVAAEDRLRAISVAKYHTVDTTKSAEMKIINELLAAGLIEKTGKYNQGYQDYKLKGFPDKPAEPEKPPRETDERLIKLQGVLPGKNPNKSDLISIEGIEGPIESQPIEYRYKAKSPDEALKQITGDDALRPILSGIFHDAENQVKAATNSFMIVVIPTEIKGESRVIDPKTGLELEGVFPRYQSVIPTSYPNTLEIGDAMEFMSELKGLMRVGDFIDGLSRVIFEHEGIRHWFDPEKLYKVFNALKETGSKNFILEYSEKEGRALVIKDAEDPRKLGLIMPVVNEEGKGLYKVIDPSNIIKSAAPVPEVKEVEKPASAGPVDITKDLKDMKDLLKFIGGPESGSGTEVADSPDVAKVKLGQIATKMIEKFTGAGITDFNTILTHIIPAVDLPTMKRLLPYLKQGYTGYSAVAPEAIYTQMETQLRNVRGFGESQLDSLIGQMNKPAAGEDYSDIVGKEFSVPAKGMKFKIIRVEKWDDPRDQKFELMEGGLFGELPKEFEPILVAVISDNPRKGIRLDMLQKGIDTKKVVEVIPYENKERALEYEKLAKQFERYGDSDTAAMIRSHIARAPYGNRTWQEEFESLNNILKEKITENQIKAGEVWFKPIVFNPNEESFYASIDRMHKGSPLEEYIKIFVPENLLIEARLIEFEMLKLMHQAGLDPEMLANVSYLKNMFSQISVKFDLMTIGEIGKKIQSGDKRTKQTQIDKQLVFLQQDIVKGRDNLEMLKRSLLTWMIRYRINNGDRIADYRALSTMGDLFGITDKNLLREQMEAALVGLARLVAIDKSLTIEDRYNRLLTLYNTIPTLGVKSSNSKELQQYSTPIPIGFLMNVYTNAGEVNSIFEPQAGNGALLIGANKKGVSANEIDPVRRNNLSTLGYRTTDFDARESFKDRFFKTFDAILTNPPFGGDFSMTFPGDYKLIGTHAMVANSLEMLADNGKAGIIIGGHTEFKPNGQISGRDLQFFNYLNHYFNVEDVINIPGDFYSKMGTSYPIRLILINGKKPAPSGFAPLKSERDNPVTSWSDLYDRVNSLTTNPDEKSILRSSVDADGGTGPIVRGGDSRVPKDTEGIGTPSVPGESLPDVTTGGTPKENNPPTGVVPGAVPRMGTTGTGKSDNEQPPDVKPVRGPEDPIIRRPSDRGSEVQPVPGTGDIQPIKAGNYPERTKRTVGLTNRDKDEVIPYRPLSRVPGGNTLTPGAMANELEEALNQLKGEVGDIDTYVMGRLKYNSIEDLSSAFYAEQVDGVGMSVFNIENGDAVIIGDQTGVGKGRIAAGIISYAVENGFIPIFITKSANLFTDIYRDLMGIGRGQYVPFIMNRAYDGQVTKVYKPNTDEVMYSASNDEIDAVLKTNRLPEKAQVILSTYSQFNTDGRDTNKRNFLLSLGSRAIFIMDESHTASGVSNVGKFFQEFVMGAKGGVYLSATFAKRPDNLPIYAMKTVLREANMTYEELIDAITAGGPALQEIISSQLSESIQFTRRQLNMENTERNWYVLGDDDPESFFYNPELGKQLKKDYDGVTKIMHDIIEFQRDHVAPVMKAKDEEVKVEGGQTEIRKGTVDMGVTNTPYFSKVFNVVDQLLVAVKVKHAIPLIIEELKAGRKPVVALKSTMEAMIGDLDLEMNEELELDFRHVLMRGLNGVMRYTVTYPNGVKEKFELDVSELGDLGRAAYYDLKNKIKEISTGVTISPIDVLIKGITDAGYQVAEITGRKTRFEMTTSDYTKGKYINNTRPNKNELVNRFNNEPGWVAILNVSGSTGISMHSSPKFNDTSQRTMFILQNDLDVNVVVQIQGRVFRSDQLNKPIFNNVLSVLPAEKRLAMMNAKKLKSLYANTSSNQKSSKTITEAVDFLNKYGDEVVLQYLIENPDINNMMGKPVDLSKDSPDKDGIAHKITGKIAVLPIETQEQFYNEISERYEQLIEYMNDTGTNDLEVTSEPLNAVTLKRELAIQGKGGISVFGDDTHIEEVEVDVLKKPLLKREIDDILAKELNGISSIDYKHNMIEQMKKSVDDITNKRLAEIQKTYDARVSAKRKEAEGRKGTAQDIQLWLDDQLGQMEEHHDRMVSMYQDFSISNKSSMERLMNFFYPGKVLEIPFTIADQFGTTRMSKGVFLGFDVNVNKPNPFTPSNVMMKFATSDSRRTFRIPSSKDAQIDQIISNSYSLSTGDQFDVLNNWDKLKPSRNREVRYIITGNILQGMAQFDKGRLIEYSMQDGTIRKGILMPESWINEDRGKVIIPAEKVYNIIRALAPMDFVESTNGNIQIMKDRADYDSDEVYYYLKVPESRTKGEKYWGDNGLKDFVYDKVFDKRGDRFAGRFPEHRLMDLLKYLQSRYGETFEVRADRISQGESSQSSASAIIREMGYTTEKVNKGGQKHPDREVQGAKSKVNMKQRIKPEPIIGGTPKKLWQIEKHFADAINQKIFWDKTARKGMAGSYTPSIAKLVMQKMFMTNLNLAAHELGHALDDIFHLVGPEAQPMFHVYQQELRELWQFGSEPPKGHPNPLQYRMMEGVAEYFRAFIVNPKETVRRYPQFSRWFADQIKSKSPDVWKAVEQFGVDVRTYYGASALDQIGANIKYNLEGKEKIPWGWTSLFKPTSKQGDFAITMFDTFAIKMLNSNRALEKAYRWAVAQSGKNINDPKDILPSENFIILARLLMGYQDKIGNMLMKGVTNVNLERQIDPITKQPISFPWKYEALPDASIPEMEAVRQKTMRIAVAQRVIEAIDIIGAKQVIMDLNAFDSMLPPLDILKKYPHVTQKWINKIKSILDKIDDGELDPDKVFLPEDRYNFDNMQIIGVNQEGFTDLDVAKNGVKEFEELKISNPDEAAQITEYNRRRRMIDMHYIRYAHESGLMSDELYEWITQMHLHYIAFHRYYQESGPTESSTEVVGFNKMYSIGNDSRGYEGKLHIHPLKGSARPIVDADLIQMEAAFSLVLNSDKNNVLRHFALALVGDRESYDEEPVHISDIGYMVKGPGQHVLKFYVAGSAMYVKIQDPHVFKELSKLTNVQSLPNWFTFMPRLLRNSITHSPAFLIKNMPRDFINSMMIAETKFKPSDFKSPFKEKDISSWDMYDLAGGGQFGFYIKNKTNYYRLQKEWMFKHSKDPNRFFMDFKIFAETKWDDLSHFMSSSEKATRIAFMKAEYNKLIKEGMEPMDALLKASFEARDLLDFAVAGEWMKVINQFMPFSNAAVRGVEKVIKTARDRPGNLLFWWGMVAVLPAVANSMMIAGMDDDTIDEYKQLPPYQRDMFFNIPLGNGRWLTIPKPFELGYMSSAVQRILDKYLLNDDQGLNEDWYRLGYNMLFPFDFAGVSGGFAGFIHALTNRDFFRNRWVIPPDEVDISISLRNTERATRIGQLLQEGSRAFDKKHEPIFDARKIDDFIQAQIPYYGTYLLKASEAISGGPKQRAMKFDWSDLGIVKASPIYNAEDVQWVVKTSKKYKLGNRPEMDLLNGAIKVYFSEEIQADRQKMLKVGADVRKIATIIRKQWDRPEVNFAKMYEEYKNSK